MKNKLWCDLKTIDEKITFLQTGRAWQTGVIARSIIGDILQDYENFRKLRDISENNLLTQKIKTFN